MNTINLWIHLFIFEEFFEWLTDWSIDWLIDWLICDCRSSRSGQPGIRQWCAILPTSADLITATHECLCHRCGCHGSRQLPAAHGLRGIQGPRRTQTEAAKEYRFIEFRFHRSCLRLFFRVNELTYDWLYFYSLSKRSLSTRALCCVLSRQLDFYTLGLLLVALRCTTWVPFPNSS